MPPLTLLREKAMKLTLRIAGRGGLQLQLLQLLRRQHCLQLLLLLMLLLCAARRHVRC